MTYRGAFQRLRRLVSLDQREWENCPYWLGMKIRGIDLEGTSLHDLGLSEEDSNWNSNSGGPQLDLVLQTFSISSADTALDIGCGKGGAMITMAHYPFARVDGIEISPELVRVAQRNIRRLRIDNASVHLGDAASFDTYEQYNFFYMYNPFPKKVMLSVMSRIALSLKKRKRSATLIYKNPIYDDLVTASGFEKVKEFRHDVTPYVVYVANE